MTRMRRSPAAVAASVALALVLLAAADGGYGPTAWGLGTIGALALVALSASRGARVGRFDLLLPGAIAALGAWQLASLLWTRSIPSSALEPQRTLLYATVVLAAVMALRPVDVRPALLGVVAAALVVSCWNLASLPFAGSSTGDTTKPIGYANALALLAVVGLVLIAALAPRTPRGLALGAAASAPLLLVAVLAESRAAWPALVVGLAAAAVVASGARRRGALLAAVILTGVTVMVVLALVGSAERRSYWRATAGIVGAHPVLGTGGGTWHAEWLERRTVALAARNAHSLPLEALAEFGPLGLALVLLVFSVPLAAAVRGSPSAEAAGAAGAVAAFAVHVAVDWHWQIPAATIGALLCAATLVVAVRDERRTRRLPARAVTLAATAAGAGVMLVLAGSVTSDRASRLLAQGDSCRAARWAAVGAQLQPWASAPLLTRAEAAVRCGDEDAAARAVASALRRDPRDVETWRTVARLSTGAARRRAEERLCILDPLGAGTDSRLSGRSGPAPACNP